MKFVPRILFGLLFWGLSVQGNAGLIAVSGDSNIANGIYGGTFFAPYAQGNGVLFANILGAGTNVLIHDDHYSSGQIGATLGGNAINQYYNGLAGVSSTIDASGAEITALAGIDLLIVSRPGNSFTAGEISAFADFLANSGTIFFLGENQNLADENARINTALAALGSSLSIGPREVFESDDITTIIDLDPLTTGISEFAFNVGSEVMGGTSLIRANSSSGVHSFIAYENVGSVSPVPEPASLVMWATFGFCGLGVAVRRRLVWN